MNIRGVTLQHTLSLMAVVIIEGFFVCLFYILHVDTHLELAFFVPVDISLCVYVCVYFLCVVLTPGAMPLPFLTSPAPV